MEKLNKKLAENLATEINIMMELKHENIVELFDIQVYNLHVSDG